MIWAIKLSTVSDYPWYGKENNDMSTESSLKQLNTCSLREWLTMYHWYLNIGSLTLGVDKSLYFFSFWCICHSIWKYNITQQSMDYLRVLYLKIAEIPKWLNRLSHFSTPSPLPMVVCYNVYVCTCAGIILPQGTMCYWHNYTSRGRPEKFETNFEFSQSQRSKQWNCT